MRLIRALAGEAPSVNEWDHGINGGDSLFSAAAADVINGFNGNDSLKGFGCAYHLDGAEDIDTVFYGASTAGVGSNLTTARSAARRKALPS